MSPRKITFVIHALQMGGAERVLTSLANHLAERGYAVSIVTLDSADRGSYFPIAPSVQVTYLNVLTPGSGLFIRACSVLRRLWLLRRTLRHQQPSVVISFIDVMNVTTLLASIGLRIPLIVAERIDPRCHKIPRLYDSLRRISYIWAAKVLVQTVSARAYFDWLPPERIEVIPNPIAREDLVARHPNSECMRLISVGRLCAQKNQIILIHAFAEVHKIYPALTLTIYGEGSARKNLESLITARNLTEVVRLPGTVSQIKKRLREADLFVFPSAYEGFPNALAEAMAAGVPVIASNCSGNTDLVAHEQTGILVDVGSVEQVIAAILRLCQDAALRQNLAMQAYNSLQKFAPDAIVQQWEEVIHACLQQESTGNVS